MTKTLALAALAILLLSGCAQSPEQECEAKLTSHTQTVTPTMHKQIVKICAGISQEDADKLP